MPPGLNRGEKGEKPDNPNKPEKPDNPGTEDNTDKQANKANKGTHKYTYDELNRMITSNIAGTTTTYTYDTLGSLVLEKSKNHVVDYQYNELNQLVQKKDGNESYTYTYDKRGNRTAEIGKKASRSYVYDETNRMVEGTNWKGDKSAYTYNGLGLRINNTQTTHAGKVYTRDYVIDYTSFENDDLMVFAEGNGQLEYEQKHVYAGSERIEQFTDKGNWERTLYVHEDVMGNTRYYTKANGQSFAELTYDAWGMPESPNKLLNNDHGNYVFATFTGHIYDTTLDIYFAEARFYDANNRTWLAMDPIKDGLNWYQYCYSNPTTYYDPLGLKTTTSKQARLFGSTSLNINLEGLPKFGIRFDAIGYINDPINGYSFLTGGVQNIIQALLELKTYDIRHLPRPNNIGVGGFQKSINSALAGVEKAKGATDSIFEALGIAGIGLQLLSGVQDSIEDGDGPGGVITDLTTNFLIDVDSYYAAIVAAENITIWATTHTTEGIGGLAGGATGIIVTAGLYVVTDVITINDYTLREYLQEGLDTARESLKEWIQNNF